MKKIMLTILMSLVVFAFGTVVYAADTLINFDDLAVGDVLSSQYGVLGVVFSNSDGSLRVQEAYPGVPFTSPLSILPDYFETANNKSRADFSLAGITNVSVVLGDFNSDQDSIFLEAYDTFGNLIGSDSAILPWDLSGGKLLSVTTNSDISYVKFWGVGGSNNSVYFDNFQYNGKVVPEPASMLLFSIGGLAFGAFRKKRA